MRGQEERSDSLFSYVSIEKQIPASLPLWRIQKRADQALDLLNLTFCELYASVGQPSVPPEQLLLASLLQAFYGIRSERLLLEPLNYNLQLRWFAGLSPDHPICQPITFTKNGKPLLLILEGAPQPLGQDSVVAALPSRSADLARLRLQPDHEVTHA